MMRSNITARRGFSLIELLVVIAIIAILAALLFPVFNRAREQTRQTQCMQQMHDIYVALHTYELDNHSYPPTLLGYAQISGGAFYTGAGQPLPINQLTYKPLYQGQKPLRDVNEFVCPDATKTDQSSVTSAVYPSGVPLSGTVKFSALVQHVTGNDTNTGFPLDETEYFYKFDDYDTGPKLDPTTGDAVMPLTPELHYSLDWTGGSGPSDPSNQLKYSQLAPPDKTVITWCTYHVAINHSDNVLLLLLSGTVKPVDAKTFTQKGPLNYGQ